ncbi:amidohydrolase family protein [bacterium]|nr:amidohydrolase family protein [bacterium]
MKRCIHITVLTALGSLLSCRPAAVRYTVPAGAVVISGGTVVPCNGTDPIEHGCVVIEGDRIAAAGRLRDFVIPPATEVIDASGCTVMPGIINAHVHHGASPDVRREFLRRGVTTVCDLGSPWSELESGLAAPCDFPAARFIYAGPIVTAPGGYPDAVHHTSGFNCEVAGPEEGRAAVRDILGRGAGLIKVAIDPSWNREHPVPMLDLKTTAAITDEAHARGVIVRAHMIQVHCFPIAVDGGIDVIEHMPFPPGWTDEEAKKRALSSDDPYRHFFHDTYPQYDPILSRMASRGMMLVPTLSALLGDILRDADPDIHRRFVLEMVFEMVRRFRRFGGVVAVGNDYNGMSMKEMLPLEEMEALVRSGMTRREVLEAATRYAARASGREHDLGTLEPGKLADILIVDGAPLRDLETLTRLKCVIIGGEPAFVRNDLRTVAGNRYCTGDTL